MCIAVHTLNLALQNSTRPINLVRDTLDYVRELNNVVRAFAKRYAIFERITRIRHLVVNIESQNAKEPTAASGLPAHLCDSCPTRWTVRANAIKSVLDNYESVLEAVEELC